MDRYTIPSHLDDPELIGFWTLDEFLAMAIPFMVLTKITAYYSLLYSRLKEKMADAYAAEFTSIEGMMAR